jgi:hypothetical protein
VARRRIYLKTVGDVLSELARQYRRADRGELPWQDAGAAARILRELRSIMEISDIERRILELERQAELERWPSAAPSERHHAPH